MAQKKSVAEVTNNTQIWKDKNNQKCHQSITFLGTSRPKSQTELPRTVHWFMDEGR